MAGRTRQEGAQVEHMGVKQGGRVSAGGGSPTARKGSAQPKPERTTVPTSICQTVPGRRQEIQALVLFGLAVFFFFVLLAGEKAGSLGRVAETGLIFVFGHLAFLVPVALLALAVTTVLKIGFRHSYWLMGALVFLFGLFLLTAAGLPPFGSHSDEEFVRAMYESRAGVVGEGIYVLLHRLVGVVGVGVIGWVTLLAGFSLATGVTVRRLGYGTKRAAGAVRSTAERSTIIMRRRDGRDGLAGREDLQGIAEDGASSAGYRTNEGFDDLVGGHSLEGFDAWDDGSTMIRDPLDPLDATMGCVGLVDGAETFAEFYADTEVIPHARPSTVTTPAYATPQPGGSAAPSGESVDTIAGDDEDTLEDVSEDTLLDKEVYEDVCEETDGETADHPRTHVGDEAEGEEPPGYRADMRERAVAPTHVPESAPKPAYLLPQAEILRKSTSPSVAGRQGERDTAAVLLQALAQFGVEARVIGMVVGPRVTRYELQLAPGTKVSKVTNLKDDLAYALASTEIRILAPIPGKSAVGVEVPNQRPDFVTLGDIYREFPKSAGPLMVWLGKDISGKAVYTDLARLPHLLIAGTTGSGKSGCVNCIISSILLRSTPEQVRFIMIDPKKVELSYYDRIPHLLVPVVTNMKDAAGVLHNVTKEMEDRYELMELEHARNLVEMNKSRAERGERMLPYILVVIDELADLMMVSPQEVEEYVIRLAQKSRAVGIHLVVATQRPSADVITGMIKANIPSRIAFAVSSQTDSRVILDVNGAETLLGMGDMLFKPLGSNQAQRVQGAYITEEEIASLVDHWRRQAEPEFREELLCRPVEAKKSDDDLFDPDADELLADAARLVVETGSASVSMLQRRLRVGYTRAGRLIDMLERRGIVGPWEGSKPRQIMLGADEFEEVLADLDNTVSEDDDTAGD